MSKRADLGCFYKHLKYKPAGFETEGLVLASSNDHYARIEIMKSARMRADPTNTLPITYFGDAEWDVRACEQLGVNLVLVGERGKHHQRIKNFMPLDAALRYVK
nr:hypothetical protein BCU47_01815 [Enterovibrio norvegicus]